MFGLAYAYISDSHVRFTIVVDLVAEKSKAVMYAFSDIVAAVAGVVLAFAGHEFAMRRGFVDSSGLKAMSNWLADSTGLQFLTWVGKVGTWQYAMVLGGVMLAVAAALRFINRIGEIKAMSDTAGMDADNKGAKQ